MSIAPTPPMTRTPAVMELKSCPFCGDSMEAALGLIRHIDPTAACPIRQQSWPIEAIAAWNHRTPAEPLADGEMIEIVARAIETELLKEGLRLVKVVGAQPDARLVGHGAVSLNALARAAITTYNPNDRLREALEEAVAYIRWLADGDSDTIVHAGTLRAKADKLDAALSHKD